MLRRRTIRFRAVGLPARLALVETIADSTASHKAVAIGLVASRTANVEWWPLKSGDTSGFAATIQVVA